MPQGVFTKSRLGRGGGVLASSPPLDSNTKRPLRGSFPRLGSGWVAPVVALSTPADRQPTQLGAGSDMWVVLGDLDDLGPRAVRRQGRVGFGFSVEQAGCQRASRGGETTPICGS